MSHAASPYTQMDDLIALRFHVKPRRLAQQQKLISEKGGYHQAIRKGRGMEFSEVREYTAGDDVRHIDWKVSARTQKTHTKVFTEELEKPVVCVLEQTPKLFFGSRTRFKADMALQLLAALGWVTLQQGDRFGGLAFNHLGHQWVEPRHHQTSVMQFLHQSLALQQQLSSPGTSSAENWLTQLSQLQKHLRPGTRVFLVGDFLNSSDAFIEKLTQLKRHADITLIHVYDPLEIHLPTLGQLKLTDGDHEMALNTLDEAFREQYTELYENAWQTLHQQLAPWHLPLVDIATDEDPVKGLMAQGILR
jgi:Uncharacterized conserved protein (some members contain a von Willebrand factor type A (vWA) domain)